MKTFNLIASYNIFRDNLISGLNIRLAQILIKVFRLNI